MMRPGGVGLRARLTALLLATLIPLVGLGGYWILSDFREERARMGHEVQETAGLVAAQVGHSVAGVQERLTVLARLPAVRAGNRQEIEGLFQNLLADAPHLENLGLVAPDGTIVVSAVPLPPGRPVSLGDREWLQRVVRWGEPAVGGFQVGRITGNPNVILAHPVLDEQGRLTAVIYAALDLVYASRAVTWAYPGVPLLWAVVDEQGLVLLHSRPETTSGKPLGPLPGMLRGETIVPGTRWHSVVGMPQDLVTARVRETFLRFALPAGLIFLISAGVGLWIAYNTWRPIRDLTSAVRRVGTGESTVQIPVQAGGELGALAAAFAETLAALDRRRGELAALVEAGRAIASSLDLEQSLQAIVQQATIISGTNFVRLLLLDEEAQVLRYGAVSGLPSEEERNVIIPIVESFSGQVVATHKPLAVADTRGDPRNSHPEHATKYGLVSYLGLPVKLGDRILGVMVFNTTSPRTYSHDETAYLSAFADQAAIAIENACLLQEERAGRRQLEAVRAVTTEITRELGLDAVLGLIIRRATELTGTGTGAVYLWDEEAQALFPRAWHGHGEWIRGLSLRLGEGVVGTAAQRREGLSVNDYRTSSYAVPMTLEHTRITAVLAEPLLYRDRLLGVIGMDNESTQRPFTQEDRDILALFAVQAAIAIENARLHEAAVRRGEELQAMLRAARTVMSGLDLRETLERIIKEAAQISGIPHVKVVLVDKEAGVTRLAAAVGRPGTMLEGFAVPLGTGTSGLVAATGQLLFIADCQNDPRNYLYADQDRELGIHTYLGLPIKIRDEVLGVLTFNTTEPHQYSADELAYLVSFADQAAIAIENARLYTAADTRASELDTLREIGQAVIAQLELRAVLEAVAAGTRRLLGTQHSEISLWDEGRQDLRFGAADGTEAERVRARTYELGRGVNGTVALTRQPLVLDDYQASPHALPEFPDVVATITVPVLFGDRLLGVLHTHTIQPGKRFTPDELRLLQMLAVQAATAIENARLYGESRRHAEELEARVRQRTAELEEALRVKVEFLGKMSHELRTPLNFVIGFSELLRQGIGGPLTPKQATYLDRILGGGKRLLDLVSDILDIAQMDSGKIRLHLEPVVLRPLVQEVLGLVQIRVTQKRLKVITALDSWAPFIVADRFKLVQILYNLVDNAVKFTPEGGTITLTARKLESDGAKDPTSLPAGEVVEIMVEDSGIGIPAAELEAIFGAFRQVDGSETRMYAGTGLGLTLVRRLVELHGGRVWAESAGPGQGSRFVVRLPRLEVSKAKRILLVEDEALIRIPMAAALESAGFDVSQAAMGADALAVMEAEAFDLLILDVVLPDMEGWEILRRVREVEEVRTLPVLVVTGLESLNAEQALALGADEFLTKPVSPRVLVDTVVRLLASSAASSAGVGPRSLRTGERPGE